MNDNPSRIDIDALRWRLAETITWCTRNPQVKPKDSLRNSRWRPPSFYYPESVYDPHIIVEQLCNQRSDELRFGYGNLYPNEPATNLAGGRLLLYDPYQNLADGAAELESQGFFNVDNEPAWDTWVSFIHFPDKSEKRNRIYLSGQYVWSQLGGDYFASCLISWIPPQLLDLVTQGVNVNPELCIAWADDTDMALTNELRKAGLLS